MVIKGCIVKRSELAFDILLCYVPVSVELKGTVFWSSTFHRLMINCDELQIEL